MSNQELELVTIGSGPATAQDAQHDLAALEEAATPLVAEVFA